MEGISIVNETVNKIEIDSIKKLAEFILKKELKQDSELNIIFVDDVKINELNKLYRKIDKPTDVLSFPFENEFGLEIEDILGDIYISYETALRQSIEYGHSLERELAFLTTHGILHLLGYDHMNKEDEVKMFDKQKEILDIYGI